MESDAQTALTTFWPRVTEDIKNLNHVSRLVQCYGNCIFQLYIVDNITCVQGY